MAEVTIQDATAERLDDVVHALTGGGDGAACSCQWWMMPNSRWQQTPRDERADMLRDELIAGPPPGLVAYVDGAAAGWVRIGPRPPQVRIGRTRAIAAATSEPLDDDTVWALSCFSVRREHRGAGLTARLLDAAIAYARTHGARVIEGYPVDTTVGTASSDALYHGALSTFLQAGFVELDRCGGNRALVALTLD